MASCFEQEVVLRDSLETLVIDEADMVLSFGYEDDIKRMLTHFPKIYQAILMSATLNQVRDSDVPFWSVVHSLCV